MQDITQNHSEIPKPHQNTFKHEVIIGVHQYERHATQKIIIDFCFTLKPGHMVPPSSNLAHNFVTVAKRYFQFNQPKLLEKAAYDIGNIIFHEYEDLINLELTIKKPGALTHAEYSYVNIELKR